MSFSLRRIWNTRRRWNRGFGDTPCAEYPLEMVSAKNDDSMNSTFGIRPGDRADGSLPICTRQTRGAARNLSRVIRVRVFNDRGNATLANANVNGAVRPGVVRVPRRWNKLSEGKMGINSLTSPRLTDMGGGPTFYSCLVEVEKCGD